MSQSSPKIPPIIVLLLNGNADFSNMFKFAQILRIYTQKVVQYSTMKNMVGRSILWWAQTAQEARDECFNCTSFQVSIVFGLWLNKF